MARSMKDLAAQHRLNDVIIPLRPSLKASYPLIPLEDYITWKREDGAPFDPWLRIHWRLGAQMMNIAPLSMVMEDSIANWEAWTGMRFPESGSYVVPGALTSIMVDRERGVGRYEEPNIWIRYAHVLGQ